MVARLLKAGGLEFSCALNEKYQAFAFQLGDFYVINFNPDKAFLQCSTNDSACQQKEAEGQCSLMIHELLHLAGVPSSENHDDRTDQIYACGRYCGFCQAGPQSANVDCAVCGGTTEEKLQCGRFEEYKEEPCQISYGVCHAGLACIADACETCQTIYINTCDCEPAYGYTNQFYCCAACPESCNASNDFPCDSSIAPVNTCDQPLPMCR